MPVIKSAKKKLKQDKKRQFENKKLKTSYKDLLKETRLNPSKEGIQNVFSSLDKATKKGLMHKNKAARLKSAVSKLLKTANPVVSLQKKAEKSPKKTLSKK